jgi:Cdc6-like AAA superfamily ATPase
MVNVDDWEEGVPPGVDISASDAMRRQFEASRVFSPSAPIDQEALFAGRSQHRATIIETIAQRGQHAVVYGERGLGKTSLVNMLGPWLESLGQTVIAPRINCDASDTFASVWQKMFAEIQVSRQAKRVGFKIGDEEVVDVSTLADALPKKAAPDDVRRILAPLGYQALLVLIFDEFDRLIEPEIRQVFADTIKTLSDHSVRVTVVLVGVAENLQQLIADHQSIERALVQIEIKRMTPVELEQIFSIGFDSLGMTIEPSTLQIMTTLSQGLPHYAHSLGLQSARFALDELMLAIKPVHVGRAIKKSVDLVDHSIRDSYENGIRSARRDNLYAYVILACALAGKEDLGTFPAAAVRDALAKVTGHNYGIATFSQHLNNLSESSHGKVLHKSGEKRRFRFCFTNPLMPPFVLMRAFSESRLDPKQLGLTDS